MFEIVMPIFAYMLMVFSTLVLAGLIANIYQELMNKRNKRFEKQMEKLQNRVDNLEEYIAGVECE